MSIDTTKDPLYQTYQGIWECLSNNTEFCTLVKANNRIDYTDSTTRSHDKQGLTTADLPQVRVIQTGLSKGQIHRTSNSSSIRVGWAIEVKVGDRRLEKLTEIEWAIYCAMSDWETRIRDVVKWESAYPVRKLDVMKVDTALQFRTEERDPAGWICVWHGEFELFVTTTSAQTYGGT